MTRRSRTSRTRSPCRTYLLRVMVNQGTSKPPASCLETAGPPTCGWISITCRKPGELPVIRKALIAAALALSGCAQVPMADPQADQAAKAFPPPAPGNGALYVYRTGYMGVARSIDVQVVGGRTAQLGSNTYLRLEGPPGSV